MFTYSGPKPSNPPQWMEETYELNARDIVVVLEQQLDTKEFDGQFDPTVYKEFNSKGDQVYLNLMSGHFSWQESVRQFWIFSNFVSYLVFAGLQLIKAHMVQCWCLS